MLRKVRLEMIVNLFVLLTCGVLAVGGAAPVCASAPERGSRAERDRGGSGRSKCVGFWPRGEAGARPRAEPIQGLNLRFLVDAQNDRVRGRLQVQTHHDHESWPPPPGRS